MRTVTTGRCYLLLTLALLTTAPGCTSPGLLRRSEVVRATGENPAVEIVGIWQPARGRGLNSLPTRGVAGQLMYFTRSNALPAIVSGSVRIYLFDSKGSSDEQSLPIHQFDFPAEDWQRFLQNGSLGPSYHVFIPYVRGGHDQVECSVLVRFTPAAGGPVVYSDMTTVTLPGKVDEPASPPVTDLVRRPESGLTVQNISSAELQADPNNGKLRATRAVVHAHADAGSRTSSLLPAGGSTTAVRPDPRSAKIQELEAMVAELRAGQRSPAPRPLPDATAEAAPLAVPESVDGESRRRFRMAPSEPSDSGAAGPESVPASSQIAPSSAWWEVS